MNLYNVYYKHDEIDEYWKCYVWAPTAHAARNRALSQFGFIGAQYDDLTVELLFSDFDGSFMTPLEVSRYKYSCFEAKR